MSAVFSAALQASRVGLSNRSVLAIVRVSFALSLAAKQPLRSFTVPAIRSRTVPPSILNTQHAKIFHTATAVLSEQTPPSASEVGVKAERGSVSDSSSPTHAELNAIFGQEVDRDGAAELLSRLQRQRRDGTLDQGLPYPKQLIDRGIEYLRAKYPVDEDAAIIARVDRELDGDWHMPQRNPKKSRTGQSGLEEIRRINQAKRDAEEEAQKAKRKEKESQRPQKRGALVTRNKRQSRSLMTEENSSKGQSLVVPEDYQRRIEQVDAWVRKSNQRVAQLRAAATMQRIPQMTKWQRLWRCGLFTLGTIGLALTFAHLYTPPSQKARLLPNIPPAAAVVGTLVAVNILVFLLWRVPYAWRPLNRYFLISTAVPRAFSLLGAEFSHQAFIHLMSNIIALWFLGTQLHDDIGRGPFLALVACGSVIPSFCSLVPLVMKRVLITSILGGSGIVTTLIATSCVLHEGRKIKFPVVPPEATSWINTAVVLAAFISIELIQLGRFGFMPKELINSKTHNIDYIGHLAGYATGIGAACLIRQTNPYWGNLQRKSFWRRKGVPTKDLDTEMLMKPETIGIKANKGKRKTSAPP